MVAARCKGLYNLVPEMVGREDLYSQLSSNFGEMTETWHGVDVNVNARLRNGLTVQGGTSSGRRLQDNCDVRAALPETYSWASTAGVQIDAGPDVNGRDWPTRTAAWSNRSSR